MQMIARILLAAAFVMAPIVATAHNELVREPRGIDALVPTSPAAPAESSPQKKRRGPAALPTQSNVSRGKSSFSYSCRS